MRELGGLTRPVRNSWWTVMLLWCKSLVGGGLGGVLGGGRDKPIKQAAHNKGYENHNTYLFWTKECVFRFH